MSLILVVDDDPATTFAFKVLLESEGFEVETAANGAEALAKIGGRRPDVVMTDVRMPEMDGNELCRHLAQEAATASIPVIVVTGIADATPFTSSHAKQVVRKPADADQLIALIHREGG